MESYNFSLHPNLKTALSCLDLELEAEVERYQKTVAADFDLEGENDEFIEENEVREENIQNNNPEVSKIAEAELENEAENQKKTKFTQPNTRDFEQEKISIWGISSIVLILITSGVILSYTGLLKVWTQPAGVEEKKQSEAQENGQSKIELGKVSNLEPSSGVSIDIPVETPSPPQPEPKNTTETTEVGQGNTGLVKVLLPPSLRTLPNVNEEVAKRIPEEIPTQADKYYYVLTEYTGDRSLEQAQRVVSNAYIGKFPQGIRIHLGAFAEIEQANTLIEEVKQQGIVAFLYHPE